MRHAIIKKGTTDGIRAYALECRLSETFMDVPQLSVKVSSSSVIDFEIGDYIVFGYNGVTYTLRETPKKSKNARPQSYGGAFVYNLIFYGPEWDLRNAPFRDLVGADNVQHFTSMPDVTTYEDVYGIAARVQACMDDMYPGKWSIRVVSGLSSGSALAQRLSETQDFSLSDGKCLHALSQVYSQWGVSFVYSYEDGMHVITIGGAETQEDTSGLFMYGKGNGLKVIKASVQNASELATRLFVYGGTQNMQPRYYNGRTMEPEYIHAKDASNPTVTAICSGRRLLGDNMYVPNLMIPVSKWGKTKWYVWTASSHSQEVFTEVRNPSAGSSYTFDEPNIGSSRNVISSAASDSIVVGDTTYQYMTEVLYPDIRKAYIDAPQSYLDKYGIRPATVRFDGSGEREDIHPSIKGLTIGDIRAGLGSEAEYYPSTSVYTDPDGRVDKVLSCDNPQDDGLTSNGANKYDSVLTASIGQTTKSVDLSVEETEEDDPQYGTIIRKTYVADNVTILSKAFAVSTSSKGILHFVFPLRLAAGMRGLWHIRARVVVYREDSSGGKNEIVSYEKYVHGSGENGEINLTPTAADVGGGQYSINAEETLYIDVIILSIRAEYDEEVQSSYSIVIPAYTQQWRFAISLGAEFYIKLKQIGFDISDVPTNDGESPVISMTSGQCGGYEFEIHDVAYNSSDDSWTLRCARVQDSVLGQWFPNSIFRIEPDDTFVLLNIALPEVYITANEQRLYDAALAEDLYEERPLLEPEIDSKVMAESPQVLRAGMWFQVKDTDLGLTGADGGSFLILIDGVEVTDKPDSIRSFKVTLRNNKEDNVFVRMQRQIAQTSASMRRSQTKTSVSETPTKSGGGDGYVDTSDFVTLYTDQIITGEKTFANDVIFGAAREDGTYSKLLIPSTSGPGIYSLCISTQPVSGEAPTGSGGIDETELWTILGNTGTQQIGAGHLTDALAPYATQSWVQQRGYLTSVGVSDIGGLGEGWASLLGSAPDFYSKSQVYSKSEADSRFVTLATEQTISGKKSFTALLTASAGISSTDADLSGYVSASKLYVPFSGNNKKYSLLISTSPVGGETPTGSGGLDETELWSILTDGAGGERIAKAHLPSDAVYQSALSSYALKTDIPSLDGYATKEWVEGKGYLTSVSLSTISDLHASWDSLLQSAPDFYSKDSVYTKSEADRRFVGIANAQTVSGRKTFSALLTASGGISGTDADLSGYLSATKLYLPYSGGNKVYDICISTQPIDGEAPSEGIGLDEEAMWTALRAQDSSKVIDISHIPAIPTSKITGLDSSLSSYAKKDGGNASGTWPISISGNAATADVSNYLFLNPNNSTHTSQNDAVPANGRFAIYDVNTATTAGGNDGYIMAFRWPSGNFATQVFLDVDNTGIMALRHRSSTNAWTEWYRILHSGNIGSYALTKSNYASTLDSRYVNVSGDTMTGRLVIDTSVPDLLHIDSSNNTETFIKVFRNGTQKAAFGYYDGRGSFMYNWVGGYYFELTDGGGLQLHKDGTLLGNIWHSGNDGSGSGLDADLLDGQQGSYYAITTGMGNADFNAVIRSGIYRLSYTTGNGASNGPSGCEWGNMLVLHGGGDTIAQLAFGYTSSARPKYRQGNPSNVGGIGSWSQWFTLATTLDNVYSATKLQTSRTLWGRPFNGEGNVSGDMTGVGSITASGFDLAAGSFHLYESASHLVRLTQNWSGNVARIYAINNSGSGYYDMSLGQTPGNSAALYFDASAARWGIGTTSPAYKLDVAGEIRATSGITIGSTDDYGWYISTGTRISAGVGVARGVNVGSLLVSSGWADYTKVPTNGIYSKGDIWTGGKLYIPSTQGNNVFDAYIA